MISQFEVFEANWKEINHFFLELFDPLDPRLPLPPLALLEFFSTISI